MILVGNSVDEVKSLRLRIRSIPTLLRPRLYDKPILAKSFVAPFLGLAGFIQFGDFDEFTEIVLITRVDLLLLRELVPSCFFCDAGLECTFDGIPG